MEDHVNEGAAGAAGNLRAEAGRMVGDIKGRGWGGFFSFDHFYFPIVVRWVFILFCLLSVLGMGVGMLSGLVVMVGGEILAGLAAICGSLAGGALWMFGVRLWFEMFMLGFTINKNIESLRGRL